MLVLGFHGGSKQIDEDNRVGYASHDSACALIEDGRLVAAIEEERLNRVKHSNFFPLQAISLCLSERSVSLRDVDVIATNVSEHLLDMHAVNRFMGGEDRSGQREVRLPRPDARGLYGSLFERLFDIDIRSKLRFYNHHVSHAWSAYFPSGYDRGLVFVVDGDGDNRSGMVMLGQDGQLSVLREFAIGQSLGAVYERLVTFLGYKRFDEYKIMGLAPYGDPSKYSACFEQCYELLPKGDYAIGGLLQWFRAFEKADLLKAARKKGESIEQVHKDAAAALQVMVERISLHVLAHYQSETQQRHLCLAGGVAHNSSMNGKILYSRLFEKVYVQPAAHDAGGALGAAYAACVENGGWSKRVPPRHAYYGTHIGTDDSIRQTLDAWAQFVVYRREPDVAAKAAAWLANGKVVGWVQGRSEFGPRALGNRSILADPRPASNRLLINQLIKKRESYRPFAPSVLRERASEFFELPKEQTEFAYMTFVVDVKPEKRGLLQAVTHIDGSARVHTVCRETNPIFHGLISEFDALTEVPIVLNTSFNNSIEPIVDSVEDAISCFLTTDLHYLVVGGYLIEKREDAPLPMMREHLCVSLPRSRRLVQRRRQTRSGDIEVLYELESTASHYFAPPVVGISRTMFTLLQHADGDRSLAQIDEVQRDAASTRELSDELFQLWCQRAVILRPRSMKA